MSYDINKYYNGVILNRQIMFNTHKKKESKIKFFYKSLFYLLLIFFKIILSKTQNKTVVKKKIGINATIVHKQRFYDYDKNLFVIDYAYNKIDKEQLSLIKYINIKESFSYFKQIKKSKLDKHNNYDNIFYQLVCSFEFSLYKNLIHQNKLSEVVINGINDRHTIFIAEICKKRNIKLSIIQHGAFTKFENCYRVYCNQFLYIYDFSIKYLKYFIINHENIELTPCEQHKSLVRLKDFPNKINVAFACTPSNIHLNFEIIECIIKNLSKDVTLIVHPHPREDIKLYTKKLAHYSNVFVSKTKYKNIKFLVTRISSLGIELKKLNIDSVFINLEKHQTDYLETGMFQSFEDLVYFRKWITTQSSLKSYYL